MTEMIDLHGYVLEGLAFYKGRLGVVAQATSVPLPTLQKIARQQIANPGVRTIQPVANWLHRHEADWKPPQKFDDLPG